MARAATDLLDARPGSRHRERMRHALVALILVLAVGSAPAAPAEPVRDEPEKVKDSVILQGIARKIEAESAECSVELAFTGRLGTRQIESPSRFDSALVIVYTTEGCGGGINWSATAQVFGLRGETFSELGEPQTWSIVESVELQYTRVLIRALNQGPGDGHCCPTDGRTVEVTMQSDRPVFRQIETWKPPEK